MEILILAVLIIGGEYHWLMWYSAQPRLLTIVVPFYIRSNNPSSTRGYRYKVTYPLYKQSSQLSKPSSDETAPD